LYPDTYDLLLMTLDGPTEMEKEAAEFAALLGPQRMIPMHYWGVAHRNTFLDGLRSLGGFAITAQTGAEFILYTHQSAEPVQVIPLEPAPFELVR
jgi:L-ascorbate metabolism protein UlaG (beta-lactamase superfamily)